MRGRFIALANPGSISVFVLALVLMPAVSSIAQTADDDDDEKGWFIPKDSPAKNFYAGVGVGMGKSNYPNANQDGSVSNVGTDRTSAASGLFFGYQFNDHVAVQGGYRDLGDAEFTGDSSGGPSWSAGPVRAEHEADAWELGVMGRWPISERWYALGFIGVSWWESRETYFETFGKSELKESGRDMTYAIGFEFDHGLKDRIVYRFMGSHHGVGNDDFDINGVSAAVIYRFP